MKYLDTIIKQSLKKIKTSEEKTILRYLQMNQLNQFAQYITNHIEQISKQVEINYLSHIIDQSIYTMPINETEHKLYNEIFQKYDESEQLSNQENIQIKQIYAHLPYHELTSLHKIKCSGTVEKNGEVIVLPLMIKQEQKYLNKEQKLLQMFQLNHMKWNVPYTPYSLRFFGVYIQELPENISLQDLKNMTIDYGSYQSYIYEDYYLVYNIKEKRVIIQKSAIQKISDNIWEYKLFTQLDSAIYVDCEDIIIYETKYEDGFCIIKTNKPPTKQWNLWTIESNMNHEELSYVTFQPLGNRKKINLMYPLQEHGLKRKRSEAEIYALCNSYPEITTTQVKKVKLNGYVEHWFHGYDCHKVFHDTCDIPRKRKDKLYIYFHYNEANIFAFDEMSFLLSVIQNAYPEYEVRGVTQWI